MPAAPLPPNEAMRLEALRKLELDGEREDRFERITQLAATLLEVPIALISLVEKENQWFKSCIGMEANGSPRDVAFCAYTILSDRPLVVADAAADPRFADNALVTGAPHIRFYAGFPLHGPGGSRVGSLCAIDTAPRQITAKQLECLRSLAQIAESELNAITLADAMSRLSEQKREMHKQKELFELFMENNPGIVSIKDEQGRLVMINKRIEQFFDVQREEIIGKLDTEWLPEETVIQNREHDLEAFAKGGAVARERSVPVTGGTRHWQTVKFPFWNTAGQRFIGGVAYDITPRMRAETELRESEEQYSTLFENSSDLIQSVDAGGRVLYANRAWREALGYSREDLQEDFSIFRILHPDFAPAYREVLRKIFAGEGPQRFEARFVARDGRVLEIEGNAGSYRKDGRIVATCGIYRDISSRKQVEAVLQQAKHEAEEATAAKSQFLANISHEIRTPLNGIIGMSSMLMGAGLNETQRRYARTIESSSRVLLTLVNQVLDFSKLEAAAMPLEAIPFDLPALIEEVATMMSIRAHEKGLHLHWSIATHVPQLICGDAVRLRQIMGNLLGNAVKFTEAGSVRLEVALESEEGAGIVLGFQIADTGIGLSQEACRRIFGAFAQADASTTRRFGGTGLGLTISRQLVELMGGRMQVESEPGEGSLFSFTARFARAEALLAAPPTGQPATVSTRPLRLLVAEDNAVNQLVLREQLSRLGHSCVTVDNGREALRELAAATYDAVLIDCQMPVMDGYETVEELRKKDLDTWVVAITANALPGQREKCEAAGMDDFLLKPFLAEELAAMLGRVPLREAPPAPLPKARQVFPLDGARLDDLALARTAGGENLLAKMIAVFTESTPTVLDEIDHSLANGDPLGVARAAHKVAGGCGYFGAERLRGLCAEVERLGRDGQIEPLWDLAPEIRGEYKSVESALKNLRSEAYSLART